MLNQSARALEKWKGFDQAIDRWLDERHQLIVHLTDFAADHEFSEGTPRLKRKLGDFTTLLIDYISAGHFEFYQKLIAEGREFGDLDAVINSAPLLRAIDISTEQALAFQEKYESPSNLSECAADLSNLAESLAERFDAEDQMIDSLHNAHLEQVSSQQG